MSNGYNRNLSRGRKDFKADPLKQFLIARGTHLSYAKDLCCAGKITLKQIPEYTDKLTLIHFGKIGVSGSVDAEILRIAARVRRRQDDVEANKSQMDKLSEQHPVEDDCRENIDDRQGLHNNMSGEFDIDRERERYEKECAEELGNADVETKRAVVRDNTPDDPDTGHSEVGEGDTTCKRCGKEYKTLRGLIDHIAKKHNGEADPQGDRR